MFTDCFSCGRQCSHLLPTFAHLYGILFFKLLHAQLWKRHQIDAPMVCKEVSRRAKYLWLKQALVTFGTGAICIILVNYKILFYADFKFSLSVLPSSKNNEQ